METIKEQEREYEIPEPEEQSNPCDSCQTWDLPEACRYCYRKEEA